MNLAATNSAHETAASWALRLMDAPLDPADAAQFQDWLAADDRHPELFDAALAVWEETGAQATSDAMLDLRRSALRDLGKARNRPLSRWRRGAIVTAMAASVAAAVGLGAIVSNRPAVYSTDVGERRLVRLKDGSAVSLDADTRVSVAYDDRRRLLVLEKGRARFTVAKDAMRPFSVDAGGAVVVATGTSFSVERVKHEVRLMLYEGSVSVLRRRGPTQQLTPVLDRAGAPAERSLSGGRQLSVSADGASGPIGSFDPSRASAWEAGSLVFSDDPLDVAVARVNRYADRPIRIDGTAAASVRVSGVFTAGDTAAFVEGVTAALPVRSMRHADGTVALSAR